MPATRLSDEELVRKLRAHPEVRHRLESIFQAVEDETGDLKEADVAEMRLIEEIRRLGQEALQAWASHQVQKTSRELQQTGGVWREGKKNSAGTPPSATLR